MKPGTHATCRVMDLTAGDRIILHRPPTGCRFDPQQDGYWVESEFIVADTEHVKRRYPDFNLDGCILIMSLGGRLYKVEAEGNIDTVDVIIPHPPEGT